MNTPQQPYEGWRHFYFKMCKKLVKTKLLIINKTSLIYMHIKVLSSIKKKKNKTENPKINQTRHSHYKHITINQKFRFLKMISLQNIENLVDLHTCNVFNLHQFIFLYFTVNHSVKKKKIKLLIILETYIQHKVIPPRS